MSLTSEYELFEEMKPPQKKYHQPKFHGDDYICNKKTGHCTNTDACLSCEVYISALAVKKHEEILRGK